ncbi:MAG: FtsX-like permease family protein [Chlamydiae bacterium]|nr:FtsX-like permease family protein [Chlamydiota bacterium]
MLSGITAMYEISVALKYLLPKRKQLSVTLIALMSVGVISLVVWLTLIFLSVTSGMEKNWLKKLTDLNAPLKITPTQAYYSSYYYNIDSICFSSNYQTKTIREKAQSEFTDPYDPEFDEEPPQHWNAKDLNPDLSMKDPVKIVYGILDELKIKKTIKSFQDFEMSGGLLKLQLLRSSSPCFTIRGLETVNFLSQVSYITSFPENNPFLHESILPPSKRDIENLLYLSTKNLEGTQADVAPKIKLSNPNEFSQKLNKTLAHAGIETLNSTSSLWRIPIELMTEKQQFNAFGYFQDGKLVQVLISEKNIKGKKTSYDIVEGKIKKINENIIFETGRQHHILQNSTPVVTPDPVELTTDFLDLDSSQTSSVSDMRIHGEIKIQNQKIQGLIPWNNLSISTLSPTTTFTHKPTSSPLWAYSVSGSHDNSQMHLPDYNHNDYPILLPKNFQDSGVLLGDKGYISYNSSTVSSMQEMRLSVHVAGFYDPGIMSIGNKCIIVPNEVTKAINSTTSSHFFDKIATNGIQIWLSDLKDVDSLKQSLESDLVKNQINEYWQISSYKDYDFAKDLLQQFQSDKYLFTLMAIIIITVACCNIISLLVLLVNDKKKEIGILLSMGASSKSIALIFSFCGVIMGTIGCIFGCVMAHLTLRNIDSIVSILSKIQGHQAFNPNFYGTHLPNELSPEALFFVAIATPILALSAGLIPAIKACLLKPASILRSE